MLKSIGKSWRDSASLILLAKRNSDSGAVQRQRDVNYDILLQTRTRSASFPNSVVFPGGVSERVDGAEGWLALLSSFGYSIQDFEALHRPGTTVAPIFQNDPIRRHISLRITAIRETFEELGLLLCSQERKTKRCSNFASVLSNIDAKYWQQRVSDNPAELFNLCKEYNCYPDIWSLHYWSNWLSPIRIPKRFSTAFFVTAVDCKPNVESNSEVTKVEWSNPCEILNKPELVIYPPQFYELHRLSRVTDLEELIEFARKRSCYGQELFFPVFLRTTDGLLHLLPGDDLYPENVDYCNSTTITSDKSTKELRESSISIHRYEQTKEFSQFLFKNYKPNNHINMGDGALSGNIKIH